MKASIEGILLEKTKIDRVYNGKPVYKNVFIIYQRGEKDLLQVSVSDETFCKYEEGDNVIINVRAKPYYFNDRVGFSLVEER